MDFQFTSRPNVGIVPVWKDPATPLKREWSHAFSVTRTEPTEILPQTLFPGTHTHTCRHTYGHESSLHAIFGTRIRNQPKRSVYFSVAAAKITPCTCLGSTSGLLSGKGFPSRGDQGCRYGRTESTKAPRNGGRWPSHYGSWSSPESVQVSAEGQRKGACTCCRRRRRGAFVRQR
jgi:hypothetical protein